MCVGTIKVGIKKQMNCRIFFSCCLGINLFSVARQIGKEFRMIYR